MNLRFVEAFYWVASLKSVTRAAERLFLTQSAMSSRIVALEEELGVLLLDRRDKQFRLTVPLGSLKILGKTAHLLSIECALLMIAVSQCSDCRLQYPAVLQNAYSAHWVSARPLKMPHSFAGRAASQDRGNSRSSRSSSLNARI